MLGNCVKCLPRGLVLLSMLVTEGQLPSWGWGWSPFFNHTLRLHHWLHKGTSLPCTLTWRGGIRTGGVAPLPCGSVEKANFSDFFSTLLPCTCMSCQENGGKELNAMTYVSAFPAWCRYFLPNSSKMVIRRTGCTFLSAFCSLKSQWWQTRSPGQLLCA